MNKVKTDEGKTRFYYREQAPDQRYPSVTGIVDMLPKPFLNRWNANMTAERALTSLSELSQRAERDREATKRWLAGAAPAYTRQRSAIGTQAHDLFENMMLGRAPRRVHPDMVPYQAHFAQFMDAVRPTLHAAEQVAWSDSYRYAGRFDAWLSFLVHVLPDGKWELDPFNVSGRAQRVNALADWKTSRSIWPSVALQLSAYERADYFIDQDGTECEVPRFDGAVTLHITPAGVSLVPIYRPALDTAWYHFRALRTTLDWEREAQKTVLGAPLWEAK